FEFVKVDGKYIMDYILEECSENVKLMVDVYWLSVAGINPVDFLKKNASRVGAVHYKDLKVVDNAPEMCEVGYGNLDWDKIIACCDELNPEFIFVEQDRNFDNPFDSLKMSYDFLKAKGYK
ncbi:MAG: sugar phosphate isomerase/epimerase, partial [Clostridia bacterium]|nr:sugar phosphate isomerase/epimerase [Clostridia bacterium]